MPDPIRSATDPTYRAATGNLYGAPQLDGMPGYAAGLGDTEPALKSAADEFQDVVNQLDRVYDELPEADRSALARQLVDEGSVDDVLRQIRSGDFGAEGVLEEDARQQLPGLAVDVLEAREARNNELIEANAELASGIRNLNATAQGALGSTFTDPDALGNLLDLRDQLQSEMGQEAGTDELVRRINESPEELGLGAMQNGVEGFSPEQRRGLESYLRTIDYAPTQEGAVSEDVFDAVRENDIDIPEAKRQPAVAREIAERQEQEQSLQMAEGPSQGVDMNLMMYNV